MWFISTTPCFENQNQAISPQHISLFYYSFLSLNIDQGLLHADGWPHRSPEQVPLHRPTCPEVCQLVSVKPMAAFGLLPHICILVRRNHLFISIFLLWQRSPCASKYVHTWFTGVLRFSVSEGERNKRPMSLFHCLSYSTLILFYCCKSWCWNTQAWTGWQGMNTCRFLLDADSMFAGIKGKIESESCILEGEKKKKRLPNPS